jgi:sulfite exporter TauE/SafE
VAAASGSLIGGLATMALFALASAPGLLLAQFPLGFVRPDSRLALVLRRLLPAAAAVAIVWRTLAAPAAQAAAQSCH